MCHKSTLHMHSRICITLCQVLVPVPTKDLLYVPTHLYCAQKLKEIACRLDLKIYLVIFVTIFVTT
jgi:hypothetical protein